MSSEHMVCKDPFCTSAEFWVLRDGTVICADDDCHAVYGHLVP